MICICTAISDFGDIINADPNCPTHGKNRKMPTETKEVLYYTLKYGKRYYAPYLHNDPQKMIASVDGMLTEKKHLAVRFGSKDVAEWFRDQEILNRTMLGEQGFDADQVKVVKVTKKIRHIH